MAELLIPTSYICVYLLIGIFFAILEIHATRTQFKAIEESGEIPEEISHAVTLGIIDEIITLIRVMMAWPTYIMEYLNVYRKV